MTMPGPATGPLRRRATDVPAADIAWFEEHCCQATRDSPRELARAERTARRDGYILQWVWIWICQLLEPDGETLIALSDYLTLDNGPGTDPAARQAEQQLLVEVSGLAGCLIEWEPAWVCQLLEPDGRTLIDESVGMHQNMNPRTDPLARIIAAEMALDAGI